VHNPNPKQRYSFSFSGLKTAVLRVVLEQRERAGRQQGEEGQPRELPEPVVRDIAASFQAAVADALVTKLQWAAEDVGVSHVCVCGGVAANQELRRQLAERLAVPYSIPPIWLCTDNAAMIGAAGHYRQAAGICSGWELDVRPRLPLASW
jgi:N6-L-threonylcarbamoyladenine synthase